MVRFFIEKGKIKNNIAEISGEEYSHIKNVCRFREEDEIDLTDGEGIIYNCVINKIHKDKIEARVAGQKKIEIESKIKFNLFQSVIKPAKFDLIIEKAVELGVASITPIYTERSQYKLGGEKLLRLNRIAKMAVCQCGRTYIPVINDPIKLIVGAKGPSPLLQKINSKDVTLFLNERETDKLKTIKNIINRRGTTCGAPTKQINSINLIIGPEGGFTAEEEKFLTSNGAISATLGRRILRAETAVIASIAVLMSELEEI